MTNFTSVFKGKIKLSNKNKPKVQIPFEFSTTEFSIDQVVMRNFECLNLSDFEKRELTAKHRHIIKQYQNLSPKEVKKFSNELIKAIKGYDHDHIEINASDAGTFICLAAIFSGKLPKNKEILFSLTGAPIGLFPEAHIKSKVIPHNIVLNFCYREGSWMKSLKCLKEAPEFIELGTQPRYDDQLMFG